MPDDRLIDQLAADGDCVLSGVEPPTQEELDAAHKAEHGEEPDADR